ncbi:hypothetical protein B0H14DRAFT_2603900 [Mycena olivaceomarginata]|nr:hypothetical protein B0H14DRAFT_2603900 [Mycena olivaceomarginata]
MQLPYARSGIRHFATDLPYFEEWVRGQIWALIYLIAEEVPREFGDATGTVTVSAAITHTQLVDQIAEEMGVRKRELNIAYKFSWLKDKDKPKLLSTPNHIVKLFKDAREELVDRKKLARKKPDAKALRKKFEVMITDLSAKKWEREDG